MEKINSGTISAVLYKLGKCKRKWKTSEMKTSLEEAINRKGMHKNMGCRMEINEQK